MTDPELQELLTLTRENNSLLHELVDYVRKIDSTEYRDASDMKVFTLDVAANVIVEMMEEKKKQGLYQSIKSNLKL